MITALVLIEGQNNRAKELETSTRGYAIEIFGKTSNEEPIMKVSAMGEGNLGTALSIIEQVASGSRVFKEVTE